MHKINYKLLKKIPIIVYYHNKAYSLKIMPETLTEQLSRSEREIIS